MDKGGHSTYERSVLLFDFADGKVGGHTAALQGSKWTDRPTTHAKKRLARFFWFRLFIYLVFGCVYVFDTIVIRF